MQLDLGGHPLHTRALSVRLTRLAGGRLAASADLLDLRKRGFTPVGTELQGAGVIHQMGLDAEFDAVTLTLQRITERQPVVAFEASPATLGESCRDVSGRLAAVVGAPVDERALRDTIGGALGCSHVLTLAQLLLATTASVGEAQRQRTAEETVDVRSNGPSTRSGRTEEYGETSPPTVRAERVEALLGRKSTLSEGVSDDAVHCGVFQRDLIFDGAESAAGQLLVAVQLSDLFSAPAAAGATPAERFTAHFELRLQIELSGWPATITAIRGARRRRTQTDFAEAAWDDCGAPLTALRGLSLGKGSNRELSQRLADDPPLRDAMLMLLPALIQCRASFPDKWLNVAATTAGHPGLIGTADSCYMWRRGGALERRRGG